MNAAPHPPTPAPDWIEFDAEAFRPMQVQPVRHHLCAHPLLQLPRIAALAERLGSLRAHATGAQPGTDFTTAPETLPVEGPASELVRDIEHARAWVALHNIQRDAEYRPLVAEVLGQIEPKVAARDGGLCHRAGWIFVTSPGAVTPYHMDHEHNFILQVRGRKRVHVFPPLERAVVSERALEEFHTTWSRDLVRYAPELERYALVFDLEPGMGAYMPTTAPHWVENGPDVSITVSFTYYSRETLRRETLHRANRLLRRAGLRPRPVADDPASDARKHALFQALFRASSALDRARGRRRTDPRAAFAEA